VLLASKIAQSTYSYSYSPARGQVGTSTYSGGTSGDVIASRIGVVTSYIDPVTSATIYLSGDTKVSYFKEGSDNKALVAVTQWNNSTTPPTAECKYLIFNADQDEVAPNHNWGSPLYGPNTWTLGSTALANLYKIQTTTISGTFYIYGIDYDAGIAFRLARSGATYVLDTTNYFTFPKVSTAGEGRGVDLQLDGSNVYTLYISGDNLTAGPPSAAYLKSTVVKTNMTFGSPVYMGPYHDATTNTDITAPTGGAIWPAENAFSIQPYSTDLLLTAVGGPQHYDGTWNPASRIQKVALNNLAVTDLLRAATTAEAATYPDDCYDFRALTFSENGNDAYILAGKYGTGYVMNWRLYHTTMGTLTSAGGVLVSALVEDPPGTITLVDDADNLSGYLWALLYSESYGKIWFVRGNDLSIYGTGGLVGNATAIGSLSSLTGASLNSITLYGGEEAPAPRTLKGYTAPAFASNTAAALLERKRLLEQAAAAKE
jgi:hypothetical protein